MSAGVLSQISLAKENSWGSAATPTVSVPVRLTGGIQTNQDIQFINAAKGVLAKNTDSFIGKRSHEGSFELDLFPDRAGFFMLSALGACNSVAKSAPNGTVYDHTFTEAETKPSLTIEQAFADDVRRYAGCIVNSLKISSKAGEAVSLSAGIVAKSQATATKITAAYSTISPLNFAQVAISLGGTSLPQTESFELEYTNNLELIHTFGSNDPAYSFVKPSEVKGSLEMMLDSTTLAERTAYFAGTTQALVVTITGGTIGSSANYSLVINVPVCKLTAVPVEATENYHLLKVSFEGIYDTSTTKLLNMVLTNLVTAY